MSLEVGKVVEGIVTGITNFGAFIQLETGKTGLVHISEISDHYVKDIHEYLKEKDKVKVKILSIDDNGKISLSMKQVQPKKSTNNPYQWTRSNLHQKNLSFEDQLSNFLKESEEKQQSLKKNFDSKRSGGYKKASLR